MSERNKTYKSVEDNSSEIDLMRVIAQLIESRWLIVSITSICMIIAVLYILLTTPIYRSDALVQVEQSIGSSLLNNISEMLPSGSSQPQSAAEIELIKSRMVLGKTISDLQLDTVIEQKYFPFFGKGWARLINDKPAQIAVSKFMPSENIDSDYLILEVLNNKEYLLKDDGDIIIKGNIGKFESNKGTTILVSDIKAKDGTEFYIQKKKTLQTYNDLLNSIDVADKGKDTGVLGLNILGDDPEQIKKILNSIINNYLQQDIERKSEEAEKSLKFVEEQIPGVREALDVAENKLNLYRRQNDSVDLSLEAKSALDSTVSIETQLNESIFKEAEISKLFTKEHPAYRALLEKRKTLEGEKAKLDKRINGMPVTQQEILRLTRDVNVNQQVYMQLLNRQQELSISKASTVGNVRIIDTAETQVRPVAPRKAMILILAFILGGMLSVGIVLVKSIFRKGIESPEQLEQLGINVYATIPLSEWQVKKDRENALKKGSQKSDNSIMALGNPADLAMESIRSLRTSLHFAMMDAPNNILMISGASPSIGKTFVSVNLASVLAQAGNKVLLVDCDLRKGYMHNIMGASNSSGLAEILSEQKVTNDVLVKTKITNLDFISRGKAPPNPSELLMHENFAKVLLWASENYDYVMVDTPPILAVTDAAIIGRHSGTNMMVTRFEKDTVKEVEYSIKRFEQNGVHIKGVILNAIVKRNNAYSGYDYYQYEYKTTKE
ncbi:tyrosine-protein kinase Wzc [Sodalis sp. RH21]|uniref:tyrosine-protein kinase Wzc n=1 Tax=unclassified Sodalis (in: enterobacteria) TaxID=2636512 RepID=UPI0039B39A08